MTTRRLRTLLWLTATGMTLAALGVVSWSVKVAPRQGTTTPEEKHADVVTANGNSGAARPNRSDLLLLAERPLRQQLFDPPPPLPAPEAPPPPLPQIELISTVMSSRAEPSAWIREPIHGNTPRRVRVGDVLGTEDNPATITAIEPNRILVQHNEEIVVIERDEQVGGGRR